MKDELCKKLNEDFPHVFYREPNGNDPFSMFYFEVGDGWYKIIADGASKLEPLFVEQIKKDPEGFSFGYYRTSQLKEKFGTMRWYLSGGTDKMYDICDSVERKSAKICEQCGKPGKLRGGGWVYTSCLEHSKPEDRDNLEYLENEYDKKHKNKKNKRIK